MEYASHRRQHWLILHSFLFNPFTVTTCIARSTSSFTNLFILAAMAKASHGASITFIFALSFAAYLSMHPILLFPPLLVLLYDTRTTKTQSKPNVWSFIITHSLGLAATIGALLSASAWMTGSWDFLAATYGVRLLLPDLTPNVGLWWYFFIEMFDSFREFFLGVFWLHAASYMPGLTIRLHKQPLFVACTLTGIFAIFTPYPSIADAALYLSLMPLFRHLFPCKIKVWLGKQISVLITRSDALYLHGFSRYPVRVRPRTGLLPPLDLRRFGQRQLLLCHYACVELGTIHNSWGLALCSVEGRVGRRTTRIAGQRGQADMRHSNAGAYESKYNV
jgi:hypothetical protein